MAGAQRVVSRATFNWAEPQQTCLCMVSPFLSLLLTFFKLSSRTLLRTEQTRSALVEAHTTATSNLSMSRRWESHMVVRQPTGQAPESRNIAHWDVLTSSSLAIHPVLDNCFVIRFTSRPLLDHSTSHTAEETPCRPTCPSLNSTLAPFNHYSQS